VEFYYDVATKTWQVLLQRGGVFIVNSTLCTARVNEWRNIIFGWSTSGFIAMVDGRLALNIVGVDCHLSFASNPSLLIGQLLGFSSFGLVGSVAELRLYPIQVTEQQGRDLYFEDIDPVTPTARWAFDTNTGTSVTLTSGSGNNGTITTGNWTSRVPMAMRGYSQNLVVDTRITVANGWSANNCTPSAFGTGYDGVIPAYKILSNVSGGAIQHFASMGFGIANNAGSGLAVPGQKWWTFCDLKTGTAGFCLLTVSGTVGQMFNLTTGGLGSNFGSLDQYVKALTNGWFRFGVATTRPFSASGDLEIQISTTTNNPNFVGTGTEYILAARPQIVQQLPGETAEQASNKYVDTTGKPIIYGPPPLITPFDGGPRIIVPGQNYFPVSESFTVGGTLKAGVSGAGFASVVDVSDPAGRNTAVRLTEDTSTGAHWLFATVPASNIVRPTQYHLFTAWVRDATRGFCMIGNTALGANFGACVNLATGAITWRGSSSLPGLQVRQGSNGYWRICMLYAWNGSIGVGLSPDGLSTSFSSYTGTGKAIDVAFCQLELAELYRTPTDADAEPGIYVPTNNAAFPGSRRTLIA
jgi:hypothetical protein